jgi:hypothetical protein
VKTAFSAIMVFCAVALMATSSVAAASPAPGYTYARVYVKGQVTEYTYTVDQPGGDITAVARLKTYVHHGIGGERVKWISLSDAGQNLTAQAKAFPPYDMSVDPAYPNGLPIPNTQNAGVLQYPVDDLYTFYEGLSGTVGIGNVHQAGQSYLDPTLLRGNLSTATAPVGQDLVQITTTLTSLSPKQATFTEVFLPPADGGLTVSEPWMNAPVCGSTPNNFELVQEEGTEWGALWGCESFTDTIVVDRPSGRIVSAHQTDSLQVDSTVCQDEALTECGSISSIPLLRTVELTRH